MNHKKACVSECMTCRSRHMSRDEIAQERRESGWNPYWAEEETGEKERQTGNSMEMDRLQNEWNSGEMEWDQQQGLWGPLMGNEPMLEAQRQAERDLRQLQSMYPEAAKIMLPYIEETCDKMEYDGSTMYDQYPDRMTVYRLAEEIFEKAKDQFPKQCPVIKDEMLAMQYRPTDPPRPVNPPQPPQPPRPEPPYPDQPPYPPRPSGPEPFPPYGYNQPGVNWVRDLAQILLLNEMHHRRRRKKNLFN